MKKFIILLPVFNDWESATKLLKEIDLQTLSWESEVSVIIVNDASTEETPNLNLNFKKIKSVKVLNMKKNQGHGISLATGLKFIIEKENFDYVIPMDSDGEDRPEELNLFYEKFKKNPDKVIIAERVARSEKLFFKLCYQLHKFLTFVSSGHLIKFGNYTFLPKNSVIRMVEESSTWLSFSGTLTKLFSDKVSIPSVRSLRYFGPSKMSFFKLILHSFSIIAVFKKTVFLRSFIFLSVYLFLTFQSLTFITLIPVFLTIFLLISILWISNNKSLTQFHKSLENISSINNFR
tara:strand:- start:1173 stop:2045 length:873 start_codon:yes stop_codon:yes gene_type:complete